MAKHFSSKPSSSDWVGRTGWPVSDEAYLGRSDKEHVDPTEPFPRLVDTGTQSLSGIDVPFVDPPVVASADKSVSQTGSHFATMPVSQLDEPPVDTPVAPTGNVVSQTGSHFATPATTDRVVSQTGSHFATPVDRNASSVDELVTPSGNQAKVPPIAELDEPPTGQIDIAPADQTVSRTGSHFATPPADPVDAEHGDSFFTPSVGYRNVAGPAPRNVPSVDSFATPTDQAASRTGSHFAASSNQASQTGSHFAAPAGQASQTGSHFAAPEGQASVPHVDQPNSVPPEQRSAPSPIFFEPPRYRVWPRVLICLLAIALALCCVEGAFLYTSIGTVRTHAHAVISSATKFAEAAKKGDEKVLKRSAHGIAEESQAMREELDTMPWVIASYVPVVGSDVHNMSVLCDVLLDLSDNAFTPMAQNASFLSLSSLVGENAVNMDALKSLAEVAERVTPSVIEAGDKVETLHASGIPQVGEIVDKAREAIGTAGRVAEHIGPMLSDLPMLMGDGGQTRTYLIVASNNSELHALGGFVGQVGVLSVTDGHFDLGEFANTMTQLPTNTLSAGATEEEIQVFGERADTHHGDHNIIPDFSRVGQLYYNVWEAAKQQRLDGVIGVDPVFLQRMLALTGGVDTSYGVTVDGNNAAAVIMNKCLFWWAPKVCDEFYKEVASLSFDKLLHNLDKVDLIDLTRAVVQSSGEGRCMAWLHDETAQRHVMQAGFGWELPHDPTAPVTGIFASDASTTKAAYYLSLDTQTGTPTKNGDGSTIYPVSVTFKHNMDRELLDTDYPGYLHSDAPDKSKQRSTSELIEQVRLIAPEGGRIENVTQVFANSTLPPREMNWQHQSYQGLDTWGADMYLDVDESCTISYIVVTSPEATEPLQIRQTPVVPHDVRGD